MNPINLLLPNGTPSKVWACGECKMTRADQFSAEHCCTIVPCKVCGEPSGKKFRANYISERCDRCERAERSRKDAERLERSVKLESWDGWVWNDGAGPNEGYFPSLEEFVDWLVDEIEDPADWPDYVFVAESRPGVSLDIATILENYCDDGYEDMMDDLKGCHELSAAINAFNAANKDVIVYDGDYSRAVRVPKPEVSHDHA